MSTSRGGKDNKVGIIALTQIEMVYKKKGMNLKKSNQE